MPNISDISVKSSCKATYLNVRGFALRKLGPLFRGEGIPLLRNIRSILFIRVDRVGDMALSTPALRAIRASLPKVQLMVMASPSNAPILKNNPDVDEIIVYDRSAGVFERMQFINRLRSRHFDLAIDPYNDYELRTAFWAGVSGAVHRIGYASSGREIFFHRSLPKMREDRHFVDGALDLLKLIGIPPERTAPAIYLGMDERAWAGQWLQNNGFQRNKIIAIHPGAYYETQRWPPEHYAELITLIRQQTPSEIVLLGGPSDAAVIENILVRLSHPVRVSIQEDIRKFLAILSHCRVLVCNNSGPLHCAGALKIPTISIMGPTVKDQWMPLGDDDHVLRLDNLACIGCNQGWCKIKTHDCMRLIRPEKAMQMVLELMES